MATASKGKGKSKATAKSVSVILSKPQPKTKTVRYDAAEDDTDAAVRNAYVTNEALDAIGNPAKIKVTIEAA